MKVRPLTVSQLKKICRENKYIALRYYTGEEVGMNCGTASLKKIKNMADKETEFVSYRGIDINEYIGIKASFA